MENNNNKPFLRFKGFSDDWKLHEVLSITRKNSGGGTPSTNNEQYWNGSIPWIQSSDLIENNLLEVVPKKFITETALKKSASKLIDKDSIAIVIRVGVGKLALLEFPYASSQDFLSLSKLQIKELFAVYSLEALVQSLQNSTQGTSIKGIRKEELLSAKIFVPSMNEQELIGTFLMKFENLIAIKRRRYDFLQNVKKFLTKKMFPQNGSLYPALRFSGFTAPWEQRKLSDLVEIERGGSPRPIENYITNEPEGLNWIKIGDAPEIGNFITKTAEKIKPSGLSKTRVVYPGDLILSNSMSFGKPFILKIQGCIHDGWLAIRDKKKNFDLLFLCFLLGTPQLLSRYKSLAAGSTVNNLNKELVGNTTITFPSKEEQKKIKNLLNLVDQLITLQQR